MQNLYGKGGASLSSNIRILSDEEYMQFAYDRALEAIGSGSGEPFGAVIVKYGIIVGSGYSSVVESHDPTSRAVINAIRNACHELNTVDLSNCTIYCTGYPSHMEMEVAASSNISKVVYGCGFDDMTYLGFECKQSEVRQEQITTSQINRAECLELFKKYREYSSTLY